MIEKLRYNIRDFPIRQLWKLKRAIDKDIRLQIKDSEMKKVLKRLRELAQMRLHIFPTVMR